ncbi:alpha/beta hydrolase [Lysinibacillus endophyticus]|uniref:alpha/beta hydrolase n=1 Tax=Ureibacillus endophyticus TaxID=1978490 RepID=UPI0020A11916|nr:alpha/beta hydrolase [Lysinibacillus endophyticus]MCP1143366.1 alpha/beta hydrolase [Lysinibacillus endophyticus]
MKRLFVISLFTLLILVGCNAGSTENGNSKNEEEKSMTTQFFGEWAGNIEIPNSPLPIIIKLEETTGTFSVPMQGLENYPFESVRYNEDAVDIQINLQGQKISIKGKFADEKIEGTFTQNGATFPVTFTHYDNTSKEEITYEQILIPVDGGELKVALQKAKSGEPSPVAIIVAGSGPTDKNGNSVMGVNSDSYKMLAEQLAEKNISTIRYDKRGIGENTLLVKDPNAVRFDDFAKDIASIIAYINSQESFTSVHVIGHSEGAFLSILAAQEQPIDSLILLSGTGRRIDEVMIDQLSAQLSPALVDESKEILEKVKAGETVEEMSNELKMIFPVQSQPYLTSWIKYDPKEELAKVSVPIFVIHGTTDLQVTEKDVEPLRQTADKTVVIEGMNHILKDSPSDVNANLATYTDPSLPLHEELVPTIEKFINR